MEPIAKSWTIHMPFTLAKGMGEDGRRIIKGYASVEAPDHIDETVLQDGLDWSYWKKYGKIKWVHATKERPSQPGDYIATPLTIRKTATPDGKPATYIEGEMLDTKTAGDVWELARSLEGRPPEQQLGFSVEGGIQKRTDGGKTIAKAIVVDVAVDPHPMQPDSRAGVEMLARSLKAAMDEEESPFLLPQDNLSKGMDEEDDEQEPEEGEQAMLFGVEEGPEEEDDEDDELEKALTESEAVYEIMARFPDKTRAQAQEMLRTQIAPHFRMEKDR